MNDLKLDYFYGSEAEQFSFYRLPKVLFTDMRYAKVSAEAKVLYGLLLDRMCLSLKNGWVDEENRVYIYFKLEDAMAMLNIGKDKGVKLFAELDCEKGCGLIRRKKQGLGKPSIIYVMNFVSQNYAQDESTQRDCDVQTSEKPKSCVPASTEVKTAENPKSGVRNIRETGLRENRSLEVGETAANDNKYNYNNINNTDLSDINPILSNRAGENDDRCDGIDAYETYRKIIAGNIDFEILKQNYSDDMAEGVLELMTEVVCSKKPTIVVASQEIPQAVVKSRLLKLDYTHIEYVFDCLRKGGSRVRNIKSYMLTMLYNSYATIGHYYTAEVAADALI